jgi:acetyl/propionyl-CoA carboxylase alpha subunit
VRFSREAGYQNAGTVEFLLQDEEFYFLEMNARLQVEHPVTELVTGLDLVQLQLAVAAGEPLPLGQDDVTLRGSAIETRLYAEDERGMPSGGRLEGLFVPEGAGVRNDSGFEAGDHVPLDYDAMLAKLIVYAPDRASAVGRLRRALSDYGVLGVPTNLPLLRRIASHPAFEAGLPRPAFSNGTP